MSTDTETADGFGFGLFDVPVNRAVAAVVAMISLDAIWWVMMYDGHVPMPGMMWLMEQGVLMAAPGTMELGVFHVGTLGAVVGYVVMWGVVMWVMMHPAMTRFTREYTEAHQGSALDATMAVTAVLLSYHIVWALSAVIPLGFNLVLPGGIYEFTQANTHLVIGSVLMLTDLYQPSEFKQSRLRACCARIEPHTADIADAFEEGLRHGIKCVLICFGPFFLIMLFDEINFFWMVALTAVVTVERLPDWGGEFGIASGLVAELAGFIVLVVQPALPVAFTMSM